ncbi:PRC-barrel domain-containing protein [Jannaschia aquimarina]|uniref:PRC-barrel domain protein n=1 Tax=Jannaschia aquimarina TaxID=935700 RepID=A0A0D1EJ66_9RHOB|nr:PRC-barrel domain-containing protein [Jannaschia aquimarina]KIT17021.1 PRC-barrel domain protein [Jannaschia aquimarina]SNS81642.1 PRC-barrel domain-containing protein [Jannaschia aquimarina]
MPFLRPALTASLLLAAPGLALADAHASSPFAESTLEYGESYMATTLIGTRIHATEAELTPGMSLPAGTVAEWDDIGEIGDLIIGTDGSLEAVVVDVGGFLGLGEREVAISWDMLRPVYEEDNIQEYFLGVNATEEMMRNAPQVTRVPTE